MQRFAWWKEKQRYLFIVPIGIVILGGLFLLLTDRKTQTQSPEEWTPTSMTDSTDRSEEEQDEASEWVVDVKGAVKKPGIYTIKESMRVWDAIELAGGLLEDADAAQVNFSKKLADQQMIYVPKLGEEAPQHAKEVADSSDATEAGNDAQQLDLNQATESELQTLTGIGQKKAQEIIRYREEHGRFQSVDELKNVSGIGEKTVENLREFLTVQ